AVNQLENKAKEYNMQGEHAESVKTGREVVTQAFSVLYRGRVVESWNGVASSDVVRIRTSLVSIQKSMCAQSLTPSKVLGGLLTDVFRKGLRSQ
ncbi:unnamed protein product, partial [Prorocentrum cordatum]